MQVNKEVSVRFDRSTEALAALLAEATSTAYDQLVEELRQDSKVPQVCLDLYAEVSPRERVVQAFEHGPFTFVYDSPSRYNLPGDDRTVVALGVSQPPQGFSDLLAVLEHELEGPGVEDAAVLLVDSLDAYADSLPTKKLDALRKAAMTVMELDDSLSAEALRKLKRAVSESVSPELVGNVRQHVLPVLGNEPPPRSGRAQRQYRKLSGMPGMDVGHFIAHATGGSYNVNTFPQNPELNRGWSEQGKKYRAMERFIADHPGLFYFSRPVYVDETWVPRYLQLGVLVRAELVEELPQVDDEAVAGGAVLVGAHGAGRWWIGAFDNEKVAAGATRVE